MVVASRSYRRRSLLSGVPRGENPLRRILVAFVGLVVVTIIGTVGYMAFGLSLVEALYQTVFTVATVGYSELYTRTTATELFTIVLILLGVGTVLYNLGVLVEAVTEGHLREFVGRRRMDRTIEGLHDHVIVCGYGRVGRAAARHLLDTGHQVVVVDSDAERLAGLTVPFVHGDASRDLVLREAGIERARALVCALDSDAETTYATLSARSLCPDLVIVSRARTVESKTKLVRAGATRAVNPQLIGGQRMATFAMHADVAEFLDGVMHDENVDVNIEQVRIHDRSSWVGRTLEDIDVEAAGVRVLAVRQPHRGAFVAPPPPDLVLGSGMTLIVFGGPSGVAELTALAAGRR